MFYIGQSVDTRARWAAHRRNLRKGEHKNPIMQRAFDKYGTDAFSFEVLGECRNDAEALALAEKNCFDAQVVMTGSASLYNLCRETMVSVLGIKRTDETRRRMSEAAKKRAPMTQEVRDRISETKRARGQRPDAEHMDKLAELAKGRKLKPEHIETLRSMKLGVKKPAEEIARRTATRAANRG